MFYYRYLDDGYVTDASGRKINFRNTLIMMTSNIGVRQSQDFGGEFRICN